MPMYLYRCSVCQSTREALHSMKDTFYEHCANCGSTAWFRELTTPYVKIIGGTPKFHEDRYVEYDDSL